MSTQVKVKSDVSVPGLMSRISSLKEKLQNRRENSFKTGGKGKENGIRRSNLKPEIKVDTKGTSVLKKNNKKNRPRGQNSLQKMLSNISPASSFSEKVTPVATYSETSIEGYVQQQLLAARNQNTDTNTMKERYYFPTPTNKNQSISTESVKNYTIEKISASRSSSITPTSSNSSSSSIVDTDLNGDDAIVGETGLTNGVSVSSAFFDLGKKLDLTGLTNGVTVSSAFSDLSQNSEEQKGKGSSTMVYILKLLLLPLLVRLCLVPYFTTGYTSVPQIPLIHGNAFLQNGSDNIQTFLNALTRRSPFAVVGKNLNLKPSEGIRGGIESRSFALRYRDSNLILSSKGQTLPLLVMTAERNLERDSYYLLNVEGEDDKYVTSSRRRFGFRRPTLKVSSHYLQSNSNDNGSKKNKKVIGKQLWKLEDGILENYSGLCLVADGKLSSTKGGKKKALCSKVEIVLIDDPKISYTSFHDF